MHNMFLSSCSFCAGSKLFAEETRFFGCLAQPNLFPHTRDFEQSVVSQVFSQLSFESGQDNSFENELGIHLTEMASRFAVRPGVGFWDDAAAPNAFAVSERWMPNTHGTVGIGRSLIAQHLILDPQGSSISAIAAHEFAHILQLNTTYLDVILGSELPNFCIELHADYLAGSFLRWLMEWRPNFPIRNVGMAWRSMPRSGFGRRSSHGQIADRLAAMEAGFFTADDTGGGDSMTEYAAMGLDYLFERYLN